MIRKASAVWKGSLKEGKGTISSDSGVLSNTPYSFSTRFENAKGTNPEELIAAAHAGCFSMALSAEIEKAGFKPESISTTAKVRIQPVNGAPTIDRIELTSTAQVAGLDNAAFQKIAEVTKANCPVSRVLKAEIVLTATLKS